MELVMNMVDQSIHPETSDIEKIDVEAVGNTAEVFSTRMIRTDAFFRNQATISLNAGPISSL